MSKRAETLYPALNIPGEQRYAMTKTDAMFWSGETLRERLAPLIEPICARAY